ncbi:MAG: zinc ribbon domain-containing protein [Deltaproteobacteria bacterium]|nr:zinc ribbon domain-containing protein [Deltaproteobacteria bacterium]
MPLYEYRCQPCERTFEKIRRISEREEPVPCPECGEPAGPQMSAFAVGGGSYGGGGGQIPAPSCGGGG